MAKVCKKHQENPARIYSQCIVCEIDNLNQRIREQEDLLRWFRERQGWISVEERMPEYNNPVLISANGKVYTATLFETGGIEYWSVNNRGNSDDPATKVERVKARAITHWMPLPEPPMTV